MKQRLLVIFLLFAALFCTYLAIFFLEKYFSIPDSPQVIHKKTTTDTSSVKQKKAPPKNTIVNNSNTPEKDNVLKKIILKVKMGTFLGNERRNYYGNKIPEKLDLIWHINLGGGKTHGVGGLVDWYGAGWTGQPLMIEENGKNYLIQGAYDHHLKKIDAETGEIIWQYRYDDVIKGTGSFYINRKSKNAEERYMILQGSRAGIRNNLSTPVIPSYRAISYLTGKELWRLNSKRTRSYSRDVDGSALILNDTAYLGLENGIFTVFIPDNKQAEIRDNILQPKIIQEEMLYKTEDVKKHGGNLVTESSPALLNNHIYISSGSGHIWGYNLKTKKIDWDFFTGSDIDGSPVVTNDSCLLVTVEKQYIKGKGGVLKLNPAKPPDEAVEGFFPTENNHFVVWDGGIIGSVSTNDTYNKDNKYPPIAAFTAIDGYFYIIRYDQFEEYHLIEKQYDCPYYLKPKSKKVSEIARITGMDNYMYLENKETKTYKKTIGPNQKNNYRIPKLVYKQKVGESISTPIIVDNRIAVAGYGYLYIFEYDEDLNVKMLDYKAMNSFEATPIAFDGRLYIASRDGFLYCLGDNN